MMHANNITTLMHLIKTKEETPPDKIKSEENPRNIKQHNLARYNPKIISLYDSIKPQNILSDVEDPTKRQPQSILRVLRNSTTKESGK